MHYLNKQISLVNLLATLGSFLPVVVLLIVTSNGYAQTITKTASPTVQVPSTVGRITKWAGTKSGAGILGDSVITESAGNILIGGDATANTVNATTLNVSGNATVGAALSGNTINATTLNVSSNATVGGTLSGNIVNATTQYNIGGSRVLSNPGTNNLFAGVGAGQNNTFGNANSFFGFNAGAANTIGTNNAFFGVNAGAANLDGDQNSFFGGIAGASNTSGIRNAFFGFDAGFANTGARENNFFGDASGRDTTTGDGNSFFGTRAGWHNTTGIRNSFFGVDAGGVSFTTGTANTAIGNGTSVGDNLDHATAVGADATVLFSNQIVLGRNGGQDSVFVPGNLTVGGTLFKSGGSFTIDYPLDPANKTLSHSFVESPDMMNVYNGNISTDAKGEAMVELPEYFEALNRDYRYQLTVIGQFAQAIVASEIKDNRFTIKTDKPNVKVSWQVTGIRQDAYANANRIQVVEDKGKQRGTYLHPELFNSSSPRRPVTVQR